MKRALSANLINFIGIVALVWLGWSGTQWLLIDAIPPWQDRTLCTPETGACWPFWREKFRLILFGTYPYASQWRALLASILLVGLVVLTGLNLTGRWIQLPARTMVVVWIIGLALSMALMIGGWLGLDPVPTAKFNGLPVLLILSVGAIALAIPLGILLAFARHRSLSPTIRMGAAIYIEGMRAIPMVSVLFIGIFILPLAMPKQAGFDPLFATFIVLIFFHAAYVAEDVRGGLISISIGQVDAGRALGLSEFKINRLVLLPQALHQALPALMNTVIGAYKDTSLILILGLFDLVATARMAFSDPLWQGQALESYVIVGSWFFLSCAFLSWVGRHLVIGPRYMQ